MFTLPPELNTYITAALFVLGAYLFALYLGLLVWTFRDIRARSRDALAVILAPLLVALFTLPGLLIYLLLRPRTTLAEEHERDLAEEAILQDLEERRICPGCRRRIEPDYILCPDCHYQLKLRCPSCDRLVHPSWDICPYCGVYRDTHSHDVEQPVPVAVTEGPLRPVEETDEAAPRLAELGAEDLPEVTPDEDVPSSLPENAR